MTELLLMSGAKLDRVLEIGTGSGYQTCVLAPFVKSLFSVERVRPLQEKARQRIRQLSILNVQLTLAGATFGWPTKGPYDAILSAAAPSVIPNELKQQLAPDGVLVIPVGDVEQVLVKVVRIGASDDFEETNIEPVRFVPLLSGVVR